MRENLKKLNCIIYLDCILISIFEKSPDGRGKPFNKMMTNGDVTNM